MQDTNPYDSSLLNAGDVNFRVQHLRIFELIGKIEEKKLDILEGDASLRRYLDKWDIGQKSLFIESLMLDFPLPAFYFDGSLSRWKIIDGLKRMWAIYDFITGDFRLTGLDYFGKEAEDRGYEDLPGRLRNRIKNAEAIAYIINPGTPLRIRYNIFKRIHTTGNEKSSRMFSTRNGIKVWNFYSRNSIKTQNVFFQGKVNDWIRSVRLNADFQQVVEESCRGLAGSRMMTQREYIRWFVAFRIGDLRNVSTATGDFTSAALLLFYERFEKYADRLALLFDQSMERMRILFSKNHYTAFPTQPEDLLIFTLLSGLLADLDSAQFRRLENHKEDFLCRYKETDFYKNRRCCSELPVLSLSQSLYNFINPYMQWKPPCRYTHNPKHGEHGKGNQPGESPLAGWDYEAEELLHRAVGQSVTGPLFYYDEKYRKHIEFKNENTQVNSYHAFHIDTSILCHRIPKEVMEKIELVRK